MRRSLVQRISFGTGGFSQLLLFSEECGAREEPEAIVALAFGGQILRTSCHVVPCPPPIEQGGKMFLLARGILLLSCVAHFYSPLTSQR